MQHFDTERPVNIDHVMVDKAAKLTFHRHQGKLEEHTKAIWDLAFEEGAAYQRAQQRAVMRMLADECNQLKDELKMLKWSTAADVVHLSPQPQFQPVGEFWARHRQIIAGLHDMANGWTTESVDSRLVSDAIAHMEVLALRGLSSGYGAGPDAKSIERHITTKLPSPGAHGSH